MNVIAADILRKRCNNIEITRQPNTEYVLSLSYGKDSIACLEAIKLLGLPLDRIIHVEVWATDDIPAELPPMVEFKEKADLIIKERYGLTVEHIVAMRERERETFEKMFYTTLKRGKYIGSIYGFPMTTGAWCNSKLKINAFKQFEKSIDKKIIYYVGIAADEPERINKKTVEGKVMPLVEIGWDEAYCLKWCEENDLLSPIYTTSQRGGCWFCPKQGVDQLRLLRKNYPEYWQMMLDWDSISPVPFNSRGHTIHDYDRRFELEEQGKVPVGNKFRWNIILK